MPATACAIALLSLAATAWADSAIDYFREDRWAQEVVPALVVGDAVYLATPGRSRVLAILTAPQGASKGAAIVVHGLGVHPDYGMIGGLRSGLADLGYTTLSVQMPVLAASAPREDYAVTFAEAGNRIAAAIAYLRSRGAPKIAIVAHSMGASMANAYLGEPGALAVDAWVPVGMLVEFAVAPKEPVLDVIAEQELPQAAAAAPRRLPKLPKDACSRQVTIPGADHYFAAQARQQELGATIAGFLDRVFAGRR